MDNHNFSVAVTRFIERLDYSQRLFLAKRALLGIKAEDRASLLVPPPVDPTVRSGPRDPFAQPHVSQGR